MLSQDQKSKYEQIRLTAMSDLEVIDHEIEAELAKVKTRLLELQEDKKAVKQILDGACARLGMTHAAAQKQVEDSEEAASAGGLDELAVFRR